MLHEQRPIEDAAATTLFFLGRACCYVERIWEHNFQYGMWDPENIRDPTEGVTRKGSIGEQKTAANKLPIPFEN
jgi:hypothetical protein